MNHRILFLVNYIPFPYYFNGNTIRVYHLAEQLSKKNDLYIFCMEEASERVEGLKKKNIFSKIFNDKKCCSSGVFYRLYYRLTKGLFYRLKRRHKIKSIINKYDITHIISYIDDPFLNFNHVINIFDLTDCLVLSAKRRIDDNFSNNILRKYYLKKIITSQNNILKDNDLILITTELDKNSVLSYSPMRYSNKIIVIPNGVSTELLPYLCKNTVKQMHKQREKGFAFWGNLSYYPNIDAVLYFYNEVFLQYFKNSDFTWHIIGKNSEPSILSLAKENDNICLTGEIDDLYKYLSDISIMINPIRYGAGIKNKVLEGMALGMGIVSTLTGIEGIPELRHHQNLYLASSNEDWANGINYLFENENITDSYAEQNRKIILNTYNWKSIVDEFEELI